MGRRSVAVLNLAAECRAVEEGHHCRLAPDRSHFLVRSENRPATYEVRASAIGGLVSFSCTCPFGTHHQPPAAGLAGCKHGALAARRLEREGLARFDGEHWRTTPKADALAARHDVVVLMAAEGARGNFEFRCSCGTSMAFATLNRQLVEDAAAAHVRAKQPMTVEDLDALFDGLG